MAFIKAAFVGLQQLLTQQSGARACHMVTSGHWLALLLSGTMLSQSPAFGATSLETQGGSASAAINIAVIIPAVLRLLENQHPLSLQPPVQAGTRVSATQRLVLLSTLRGGFCMDLQLTQAQVSNWQLSMDSPAGAWVEPSPAGYRICTRRPGRYDMTLLHAFDMQQEASATANTAWPVHLSLNSP